MSWIDDSLKEVRKDMGRYRTLKIACRGLIAHTCRENDITKDKIECPHFQRIIKILEEDEE